MKVSGLDHLVLHVRDMARAKKFYVDVLGMTIERENSWQTFMHCGSQGVALFEVQDSEFLPGHDLNHLALVVDEGDSRVHQGDTGASWDNSGGSGRGPDLSVLRRPRRPPHPDSLSRLPGFHQRGW